MMGSGRANENDKPPPAYANPLTQGNFDYANSISPNINAAHGVTSREGNVSGGHFETVPDMTLPIAPGWENMYLMNQSITQGIPETSGNPMAYFMNHHSSIQNPQINLSSNTFNMDLPEAPSLPELNIEWSPQFINQGHSAISVGGMNDGAGIGNLESPWSNKNPTISRNFAGDLQMSRQNGESMFLPLNRPQVNRNIVGSPLHYHPRDTRLHTRNNVSFNTSQRGVQGKVEGSFLSLGIGGTEEAISGSQLGSRDISDKLREAASAELKMARARKVFGQTLDANFMGSQRNTGVFSNQLGQVDQMTSTNNEVGVHCTPNGGPGSSSYHILQMQQNDTQHGISRHSNSSFPSSRKIRYADLDHYRAFAGDQAMQSGLHGGSSAQVFNSIQYDLNRLAPESPKPSWTASCKPPAQLQNSRFKNGNSLPSEHSMNSSSVGLGSCSTGQTNAGQQGQQLLSQNGMPTEGRDGSLFPQKITAPEVVWVSSGQAATEGPFPKRLGVEFNGRENPQAAERNLSSKGTSLQTTSTGQISQLSDKRSIRLPDRLLRPSIGRTDGAPVSYPLNSQERFFARGQSQNALIQLPTDPRRAASTNALAVAGPSQKPDFQVRPYHKRPAVATPRASNWVQRQKISHPTIHHSTPIRFPTKPPIPVTTAHVRASVPYTSNVKPRLPVASSPLASHITWKDPDATSRLIGYKCLLCKRDLSLTSEGAVYQPTVPPAVAVLPCGHTFHDQCLHNITPQDQSKDPPCIPCAIGEN